MNVKCVGLNYQSNLNLKKQLSIYFGSCFLFRSYFLLYVPIFFKICHTELVEVQILKKDFRYNQGYKKDDSRLTFFILRAFIGHSRNLITLSKNPIKVNVLMESIFVKSNSIVMKVVQYAKEIIKKSIHLVYATCTNDIIIYSKQASNIELFIVAFFIECNRIFIADTVFMNMLQKEVVGKIVTSYKVNLSLAQVNWVEIKNAIDVLVSTHSKFSNQYSEETIIN